MSLPGSRQDEGRHGLILGLDCSPTRCGWGLVAGDTGRAIDCGVVDLDGTPKGMRRSLGVLRDYEVAHVRAEDVFRGPSAKMTIASAWTLGLAGMACEVRWPEAQFERVLPSVWRQACGFKGRGRDLLKAQAIDFARWRLQLGIGGAGADAREFHKEADDAEAMCIAHSAWVDLERGALVWTEAA